MLKGIQAVIDQEAKETGTLWKVGTSGWRLDPDGNPVTEGWPFLPPASLTEGTGAVYLQHGNSKQRALEQISEQWSLPTDGKGWMVFGDNFNDLAVHPPP